MFFRLVVCALIMRRVLPIPSDDEAEGEIRDPFSSVPTLNNTGQILPVAATLSPGEVFSLVNSLNQAARQLKDQRQRPKIEIPDDSPAVQTAQKFGGRRPSLIPGESHSSVDVPVKVPAAQSTSVPARATTVPFDPTFKPATTSTVRSSTESATTAKPPKVPTSTVTTATVSSTARFSTVPIPTAKYLPTKKVIPPTTTKPPKSTTRAVEDDEDSDENPSADMVANLASFLGHLVKSIDIALAVGIMMMEIGNFLVYVCHKHGGRKLKLSPKSLNALHFCMRLGREICKQHSSEDVDTDVEQGNGNAAAGQGSDVEEAAQQRATSSEEVNQPKTTGEGLASRASAAMSSVLSFVNELRTPKVRV